MLLTLLITSIYYWKLVIVKQNEICTTALLFGVVCACRGATGGSEFTYAEWNRSKLKNTHTLNKQKDMMLLGARLLLCAVFVFVCFVSPFLAQVGGATLSLWHTCSSPDAFIRSVLKEQRDACLVSEHGPFRSACVPAHPWRSSLLGLKFWFTSQHPASRSLSVPPSLASDNVLALRFYTRPAL